MEQAPPQERRDGTLRLEDGRTLGYAEYGDPQGKPVFFFHGFPNSRLGARLGHEAAARDGVRIIALERPGFGLSDFKPGRTIGDWPDDVAEAADALGIDRFAVLGVSGGAPYAAACAAKIPQRLTSAAIVSGLAPLTEPAATKGFSLLTRLFIAPGRRIPLLVHLTMWLFGLFARWFPNLLMRLTSGSLPPSDRAALARADVSATIKADIAEAFRRGSRGAAWEWLLYLRPWDFRLKDIAMEVHLWQGEADAAVPASMGRYLAETIPRCRARFYPGEGHLLIVDRIDEIHTALVA